jgi:DinB family protein
MAGSAVDEALFLLEEAFESPGIEGSGESQALLTNLSTVPEAWWRVAPAGGVRTPESIVLHVGTCKIMYANHAFEDRSLDWQDRAVQPWPEGEAPMAESIAWLRETHRRFVDHVRTLDDAGLAEERMTNWGDRWPTRLIVASMIGHDFYHAGEINHVRSLLHGDDRWRWVMETEGDAS